MFLIIIVSANNSNDITENEYFLWKFLNENWAYLDNIFSSISTPLGEGSD